jgi:uncharacterized surface protein with fasciclin (FAS1) repeats
MSRQQHSSLLNGLGLLSAGLLFASPAIAQTAATKLNANSVNANSVNSVHRPIAQTPTVPAAPTVPAVPTVPTAPTVPAVPPTIAPSVIPPMETKSPDQPAAGMPEAAKETKTTIVDIASGNDSFKILTAALQAAGLTEALSGEGPFTVFAPTDAAFAALPKGTLEKLLKPENKDKLIKVLTYHVVPGTVLAADLKTGNVKSLQGSDIKVKVGTTGAMVNNAKVAITDVKASNGVIHAIDKVILPMEAKSATKPVTKPDAAKLKVAPKVPVPLK